MLVLTLTLSDPLQHSVTHSFKTYLKFALRFSPLSQLDTFAFDKKNLMYLDVKRGLKSTLQFFHKFVNAVNIIFRSAENGASL